MINGNDKTPWLEVDIAADQYRATPWKDGKAQTAVVYRFLRNEVAGPREWSISTVGPNRDGRGVRRFDMTMAGDYFSIVSSVAQTEAGPFKLDSYTTHLRQP